MDRRVTESEILELENKLLHPTAEPIALSLGFLESITSNFSKEQEIGSGGYGVVYKGTLRCGSVIAVKKFHDIHLLDDDRFKNEASFLMGIKHQNLVQLVAFCAESRVPMMTKQPNGKCILVEQLTRMLCFEYMCNQGLDKHLSGEYSGLEWNKRYKIIKGICRGLDFLHEQDIVHLDLKPQNILMDANMISKIADFSLSRLLDKRTHIVTVNCAGTVGYMAPEYIEKGIVSKKADIFSLGVIVIQILKGRKDDYPDYHQSTKTDFEKFKLKVLSNWRNRFERASNYTELELHTLQVKQCIDIALQCVHPDKEKRPNTLKIIKILNAEEGIEILNAEEGSSVQNGRDLLVDHQDAQCGDGVVPLNRSIMKDYAPARTTEDMVKSSVAPPQSLHKPTVLACADGSLAALHHQRAPASLADWAATLNLGPNVVALQHELDCMKASDLKPTQNREIDNPDLNKLLLRLQDLRCDAEDMLDEIEYFCIQDMLDVSSHATNRCAEGYAHNPALDVSPFSSLPSHDNYDDEEDYDDDDYHDEDHGDCDYDYDDDSNYDYDDDNEPPELRFDRDDASKRMQDIVEQMQTLRQEVSGIITILGSKWSTASNIEQSRPITDSESIEPKLFGRELMMNNIIHDITKGKHSGEVLTVIPIVGPGGIGKTTLAQHIYHSGEVQEHFDVKVWKCVSLNFNVKKLKEEIQRDIPIVDGKSSNGTANELIEQRLKNKRLLLVLDDIWDCSDEDEWKLVLVPFRKSQVQGNIIIVTTRFPAQAKIMVQKNDQSIYLKGIENKEFEELFLEIIFGDDDQSRKDHTFLLETGFRIAGRLKGSPLAAKTVGRLLKSQLKLDHWTTILESKKWEHSKGKNDIMPELKLSFDYLPSQLQQCFSYCALFPQDYKFTKEELINFWIGQEVLHSSHGENERVEDIGQNHLTKLVNYGFLENKREKDGSTCYNIHDLLHELARKVSSYECLIIDSSQLRKLEVLPSIRHLSINVEDTSVKDRLVLKNCLEDFNTVFSRLKVEKLQTLMLFGEGQGLFVKAFGGLLKEAKALRVIFISEASYNVEDLLHNFYRLIHLRYLRIGGPFTNETRFPNKLSRFYHTIVLDAKHNAFIDDLPRDMSNLVKLRHFLVQDDEIHSSIIEVGKLKSLQELRRFVLKRECKGFELREIGNLVGLGGSLSIYNLKKVQVKKEADEAKLLQKDHLRELTLHWDNTDRSTNHSTLEEHVLERLKPSSKLQKLSIIGHRGGTCPSWLGMNLSLSSLESLCLDDVAWKTFPPIGDLWLVNVPCEEISINIPEKRFGNLRRLELVNLSGLKMWAIHSPCQLFPNLEVLIIKDCKQLVELSFSHSAKCCQHGMEVNVNLFSRLEKLEIRGCLQLSSFPPVPWTEALCSINIQETSSLGKLVCEKENNYECSLSIQGKMDTNDGTFWNVLAFHNLKRLKVLRLPSCESLPLYYLQMLSSLRELEMSCLSNAFAFVEANWHAKYQFPVESLVIKQWNASGKELTQLLVYFPNLSYLEMKVCEEVTGLAVNVRGHRATETPGPSSLANKVEQQQGARAEDDIIVAPEEAERGLLLLPPQLQELMTYFCPELSLLCSNPYDDSNKEGGRTGGGGGLQGLTSLRKLVIIGCPKLLSSYSSSSFSSSFPFPNSLEHLTLSQLSGAVGTDTVVPISNLTSLTSLKIYDCGDLRGQGLLSLLAQGHLTKLDVEETPNFFVDSKHLLSQVHEQEIPSCSSKLQELKIGDVAGFSAMPIHHNLLFSSLTKLEIYGDEVERFTEEQEALLFINSLEGVRFRSCDNLQSLPKRLCRLHNLKWLHIESCEAIQSLPKDCLPDSLQELVIDRCPAIQSLPEVDDLPSSLQELVVFETESKELRRQCRKLKNIIPMVIA